jgi:hypothetical protein
MIFGLKKAQSGLRFITFSPASRSAGTPKQRYGRKIEEVRVMVGCLHFQESGSDFSIRFNPYSRKPTHPTEPIIVALLSLVNALWVITRKIGIGYFLKACIIVQDFEKVC